jgi:hypothetical protein
MFNSIFPAYRPNFADCGASSCVIKNLVDEEAIAHAGLQSQGK